MEVVPSVTVLDLKIQLPFLKNHSRRIVDGIRNAEGNRAVMDAGVAAYLLNPLKDTYGYDDLARDYLDMTVPSQVDLLGKTALSDAFETMPEKALNCVCYMAYTAWKSREILLGQLRRHGMLHLFYEIEMPVIYSLYHMEEEGIQVRREELKAYGERLQTQVEKLEQEIYAETGCEFNINSPKQLGEVLFEKMSLPGGKKTKDRLFDGGGCAGKTGAGVSGCAESIRLSPGGETQIDLCGRAGCIYPGGRTNPRNL